MKTDIAIIGAGASGLMAAWSAARVLSENGKEPSVLLLEKMPRPGRKIMLTGKGRCNFTNLKEWNDFSLHISTNPNFVKPSFFNMTPSDVLDFFDAYGMPSVVERGDRAFPASYHSSDVVDTLVNACLGNGVKLETGFEVASVSQSGEDTYIYKVESSDGRTVSARRLVIATGGLSYPSTGSTGDGYQWAESLGHSLVPTFPSLTALVPRSYKVAEDSGLHIDRSVPLSETGQLLCGIHLKNVGVKLVIESCVADDQFGDLDFTDGGLEGPVGFAISRKAVKSMINGSRVSVLIDMKHGVSLQELTERVKQLWIEVDRDPRSRQLKEKEKCRILLGKLMPWDLIPAFRAMNPQIMTLEHRGRKDSKVWINLPSIASALKEWRFDIKGYVGYERAVVTAGGISTDEVLPKTLESRLCKGLYFCGEVLDIDCNTGGYNLQLAFSTGVLAGESSGKSLVP